MFKNTVSTIAIIGALSSSTVMAAELTLKPGDWGGIGGDPGFTKYSTLTQINAQNVTQLTKAWEFDTGMVTSSFRGWQSAPVVVNGVMYFFAPDNTVHAIDVDTGNEVWKQDIAALATARDKRTGSSYHCTNLSLWKGDARNGPRLLLNDPNGYFIQFDMVTGRLFEAVGDRGFLDLGDFIDPRFANGYRPGAPSAIYGNLAIFAPAGGEQGRYGPPGHVRAIDLTTGEQVWEFHSIPQPGDLNFGGWGLDGWQDRRGPGAWAPIAIDHANKLVIISMGNTTDQNYGGYRPGDNLYAASVVAIDADTGQYKWHFQATRHDIWDYSFPSGAVFIDVQKDGQTIPALAQTTKQGVLWILNRLTGEPVFGYEDRPVIDSDSPGEVAITMQPFPLKPEPIARQTMTRDEITNLSPEGYEHCRNIFDSSVQAGPMTTYLMVPALSIPGSEGGGNRGGPSFDPVNGLIIANSRSVPTLAINRPMRSQGMFESFSKQKLPFLDPAGYMCNEPPWGEMMAIDANTGDTVWRKPLGEYSELTARGMPVTGTPQAGGPVTTASGLIFVGATADQKFRAFDTKTGTELWETSLPSNAGMDTLTFQGKSGKQYVAAITSTVLSEFTIPRFPADPPTDRITVFGLP